ncbi:MAG: biotin carboxyl carrier domain-containing protein [Rhodospirillaceae bacterium]|nr:biotin carboxyl carrier domain-containing protein [Rhodospirillaceae bacterium]MYH37652.1 biotin carboxyl carrier domain-containing protein [Rhodospirillaceae bacterium]MYK14960.1 biotin carboxyl carrier domain-containing protein [Rhodospirillaceae bacterium]MYK58192.1 biotin carboxyl carrier domain-containing protein [Rhodospirillaceae bacterium]
MNEKTGPTQTDAPARREVRAMLPGTFYRKPAPDQPNYKDSGDTVSVGDVLGLIEVMKTFHRVVSEHDGILSAFLVDNEAPIKAGQVLARIEEG